MMRIAIFAVTGAGALLAKRVQAVCDAAEVFAKTGTKPAGDMHIYEQLPVAVRNAFGSYDALVFIMAAGIAVRMIASCLQSKLHDPAVIVMDERGKHVISLLSGHIGGANELARQLAAALGAEPVITTATDVEGRLAVDAIAAQLSLCPCPKEAIKVLNTAILAGKEVRYFIDTALPNREFYRAGLLAAGIKAEFRSTGAMQGLTGPAACITAEILPCHPAILYLKPRRLIAGIGCRRGTAVQLIQEALAAACHRIGRQVSDISLLASADLKKDEKGLLAAAESYGCAISFFNKDALQREIVRYGLTESDFVKQTVGAGNVAEAAALACVAKGRIALPKTRFEKVTVALVWER
jgi:cobalt-precorrin 5A hydrolase